MGQAVRGDRLIQRLRKAVVDAVSWRDVGVDQWIGQSHRVTRHKPSPRRRQELGGRRTGERGMDLRELNSEGVLAQRLIERAAREFAESIKHGAFDQARSEI